MYPPFIRRAKGLQLCVTRRFFASNKSNFGINYYEILGVKKDCNAKQLRAAYLDKCKEYHPDTSVHSELTIEQLEEKFQQIQQAYQVLSDSDSRSKYDDCEKPLRRPSGFKTRVFKDNELNRTPEHYMKDYDPYHYQRQKMWTEMKEELKKQAEFEAKAPGRRLKKAEIVVGIIVIVFVVDMIRYSFPLS